MSPPVADPGLVLVGGGGHCVSVIEGIESAGVHEIRGIVGTPDTVGSELLGYPVRWTDDDVGELVDDHVFCVTVGHVRDADLRRRLFDGIVSLGGRLVVVTASTARVSSRASVYEGSVVLHQAVVNAGATVGRNCIVNTAALVEHDARVGDHSHISTGAIVNGGCRVGEGAMIGSNAVLRQGVQVGAGALVGAGAVVVSDVVEGETVVGNPARPMRRGR